MICEECGKRMVFNEGWFCEPCETESIRAEERERCAMICEKMAEKAIAKRSDYKYFLMPSLAKQLQARIDAFYYAAAEIRAK